MKRLFFPILFLTGCLDASLQPQETPPSSDSTPLVLQSTNSVVFTSTDQGRTWVPFGDGIPDDLMAHDIKSMGDHLVLASDNYGVLMKKPKQFHWQQLDTLHLPGTNINGLLVQEDAIYVGVMRKGVFASYDQGKTWVSQNYNLKDLAVQSFLHVGNALWAGTDSGIYALPTGSKEWLSIFKGPQINCMLNTGQTIVAGTATGIIFSKDQGLTWEWSKKETTPISLDMNEGIITVNYMNGRADSSKDHGMTWEPVIKALPGLGYVFEVAEKNGTMITVNFDGDYGESFKEFLYQVPTKQLVGIYEKDGVLYGAMFIGGC